MLYNKHNMDVAKIASEDIGIFFTKNKTVATDRYRLLEVETPDTKVPDGTYNTPWGKKSHMKGVKPFIVPGDYLKSKKIKDTVGISHRDQNKVELFSAPEKEIYRLPVRQERFPDYQRVIPQGKPKAEFRVNIKQVKELLQILNGLSYRADIKFYGPKQPIVIETHGSKQRGRALIMPIMK